ncbi:class I SAM-dependent methyltransferase [Acidimicrobiia bacterium]|nr:class I SAM-dependent methyltransferase [Acidimicrobiia bacterium]
MIKNLFAKTFKNNIKRIIKRIRLGSYLEMDYKQSFYIHNSQYSETLSNEREAKVHKDYTLNAGNKNSEASTIYLTPNSAGYFLDKNLSIEKLIDIGAGTGWFVNYVRKNYIHFKEIYAIEPSNKAIEISKKIYGNKNRITYIEKLALDALRDIPKDLYLITANIVFLHLPNRYSKKILKELDKICLKGSVLIFHEPIGKSLLNNYFLHYAKKRSFWSKNLQNFNVNFENDNVVHAIKTRN